MWSSKKGIAVALLALACAAGLSSCRVQPLLGDRGTQERLEGVIVAPIPDRTGQLLRVRLLERLGGGDKRYTLYTAITEKKTSIGFDPDDVTNRYQLRLTATYKLVDHARKASVEEQSEATASYNVLKGQDVIIGSNEYSNVVSEEAARRRAIEVLADDIVTKIALHVNQSHEN